jgi:hypothetical protein
MTVLAGWQGQGKSRQDHVSLSPPRLPCVEAPPAHRCCLGCPGWWHPHPISASAASTAPDCPPRRGTGCGAPRGMCPPDLGLPLRIARPSTGPGRLLGLRPLGLAGDEPNRAQLPRAVGRPRPVQTARSLVVVLAVDEPRRAPRRPAVPRLGPRRRSPTSRSQSARSWLLPVQGLASGRGGAHAQLVADCGPRVALLPQSAGPLLGRGGVLVLAGARSRRCRPPGRGGFLPAALDRSVAGQGCDSGHDAAGKARIERHGWCSVSADHGLTEISRLG